MFRAKRLNPLQLMILMLGTFPVIKFLSLFKFYFILTSTTMGAEIPSTSVMNIWELP